MIARGARLLFLPAALAGTILTTPVSAQDSKTCGELIELLGRAKTKLQYSFRSPDKASSVLVLLPGGGGFADLDAAGCARKLRGNFLIRTRELFHMQGFATVLVDAPADHRGEDGLGGFRISPLHAADIGLIIADVRKRTGLPVWLIGTSRGTISAVNAASRLQGDQAPEGLILTSPVTSGRVGGRKEWVAQTAFSIPLETIKMPVLVVAHAGDKCIRTPPTLAPTVLLRVNSMRKQAVIVEDRGVAWGQTDADSCSGMTPHGFIGREDEVTAGIVRFINGGSY